MKKCLLCLAISFCVNAQVSNISVVQNLQSEIASKKSKNPGELQKVLEKYFNDGCKVVINDDEIVLKKENFKQYAKIGSIFIPKSRRYKLKFSEKISDKDLKNQLKRTILNAYLKISDNQKIGIDFVLENQKISEINCENIPLSLKQRLTLKGIINLLQMIGESQLF